jgi:MFS superfamily sulfate permease-like transporter
MNNDEATFGYSQDWSGIKRFWRHDLLAAFSVALVAIPLGLAVAIASGAPPIAGIITAIIGGLLTTFIRGSHIAINGPGAGLIVVTLGGITLLSDEGLYNGWSYYMSAIIVAGFVQVVLGTFKLGKYADYLPSSVVKGMLAAIGIIIITSQIHPALDTGFLHRTPTDSLKGIILYAKKINWPVAIIAFNSLAILIIHPLFINRFKVLHYIPAPMLVILFAIPFVFLLDLQTDHFLTFLGSEYHLSPARNLISLPENILESFSLRPNWDKLLTLPFWLVVISIVIISSVESLMSAKAIDKLDPSKRSTNLNKDLFGMGFSTIIAGFLGGLPVITVIVRSSLNINHGAKTRWSNLYHGLLVLLILLFFKSQIRLVPIAALSAILIYTGFKLTSPRIYSDTAKLGYEQLLIVIFTLVIALQIGLISGLLLGTIFTLLIHLVKSQLPVNIFFRLLRKPSFLIYEDDDKVVFKVKGLSNFTSVISFNRQLNRIGFGRSMIADFSQARMVDHSILELVSNWGEKNIEKGGQFNVIGLDSHITTSSHPLSLHILPIKKLFFLSNRQIKIKQISINKQWVYEPSISWDIRKFRKFKLFENRSLEHLSNKISGKFKSNELKWEICDISFDEGAFIGAEIHHTTVILIPLSSEIPRFVIEKETLLHKFLDWAFKEEIIFDNQEFSDNFSVKGNDRVLIKDFFKSDLIIFFTNNVKYYVESNGESLLIYKNYRVASFDEISELILYSEQLTSIILLSESTS